MSSSLAQQIESYLLDNPKWISSKEICKKFEVNQRALRSVDGDPGYCTLCAISGNKGYKHTVHATEKEWAEHYARERRHNIAGLITLRQRRNRRQQRLREIKQPKAIVEASSGQLVMSILIPTQNAPALHRCGSQVAKPSIYPEFSTKPLSNTPNTP